MGAWAPGTWVGMGTSPPPPPPGDPLEIRVLDAVRAVAELVCGSDVPGGRVYRRTALEYSPDRDGLPGCVVAWTPGRPGGYRVLLSRKKQWTFGVTALLIDRQGTFLADPTWRASWAGRLTTALVDDGLDEGAVPECVNIDPDTLTILDLTAYDQAGLWRSAASVVVTCRTGP